MPCTLRVGLTGGIGSGKSEAARQFARLGATVIDTDLLARELVEPGQPALAEIVDSFGPDMLTSEGALDRTRLRQHVFADPARRRQLEGILHPRIRARALQLADQADTPYCILVIPLLVETSADYRLQRVLLIDCPEDIQRQRIRTRDRLAERDIDAILAAQANRAQRQAVADDIVVNDKQLPQLQAAIERLHHRYLRLASQQYSHK
jgi:dephospho-CoA kinase